MFNVLLIEDNPDDVDLTLEAIERSKLLLNVDVAGDAQEAYARLSSEPLPQLILLDLNLPKTPGHEIIKVLRNDPAWRTIPICVLSSSKADMDVTETYARGANCYVSKPLDFNRFKEIVTEITDFWFTIVELPKGIQEHGKGSPRLRRQKDSSD